MQTITTVGLDIAKTAFQVHAIDAAGNIIVRRQLNRRYVLAFFQKTVTVRCRAGGGAVHSIRFVVWSLASSY